MTANSCSRTIFSLSDLTLTNWFPHLRFFVALMTKQSQFLNLTNLILINKIKHKTNNFLDKFIVVFIDDISACSNFFQEHEWQLRQVLHTWGAIRQTKLNKCEFWLERVTFLGHVVSVEGIYVNLEKIEAVWRWGKTSYDDWNTQLPGTCGVLKEI